MSDKPQNKPLTPKQESFARHYVANGFNGSEAARLAGYSEDTAQEQASRLLSNVIIQDFIKELQKVVVEKVKATADDLFEFLTHALAFNPSEWMNVTKTGRLALKCDFDELPPRVQKLATKIKPTMAGVEVTWFSKEKALEMLARFHGMNNDKLEITKPQLTAEERAAKIAELKAKMGE